MRIIIKFILKNIKEKKFRTFLIVFSVMLSSALFFTSLAISENITQMYVERLKRNTGTADIIVHANDKSPSRYFHIKRDAVSTNQIAYILGAMQGSATYKYNDETVRFDLTGISLDDLKQIHTAGKIKFSEQGNLIPFSGKKIIITRQTAKKYGLEIGEAIDIKVEDNKQRFRITAIAQSIGPFIDDGQSSFAVVPKDVLTSLYNVHGQNSILYIKLKDPSKKKMMLERIGKVYKHYTVREPFTEQEIRQYTSIYTTSFMLMLTLVLFMSVFIIYTSFKVITTERLPIIGTFRSIGATKTMTNFVLCAESVIYGVTGGVLGTGLGFGILYAVTSMLSYNPWEETKFATTMHYTYTQISCSFGLAVFLAFFSAMIPIIKTSRISVKDIVLNKIDQQTRRKRWKLYLSIAFFVITIFIPPFMPKKIAILVDVVCMLLSVTAVVLFVPYITGVFIKIFERVYQYIFGNEGIIAAKNLRDNKSILNNISLLAIGISSLLMINTLSSSVLKEISNVYDGAKFDIWMWPGEETHGDRQFEARLRSIQGVEDTYGIFDTGGIEVNDGKGRINWVNGIRKDKYLDYWEVNIPGDDKALMTELDSGRNILITYMLKEKFGVEKGDYLTLKMPRGKKQYKVIGFFNSIMAMGGYALIPERYFKADTRQKYYSNIYIKTSADPVEVAEEIRKKFARNRPWLETMKKMQANEMQQNGMLFTILTGFSVITLVIGTFGILNNFIISFIERKRSLAVLRSIGMSKKQTIKMIFIESLTGGLIGGTVGVSAGSLLIYIIPYFLGALDMKMPMHYSAVLFLISMLAGMAITMIASISPALKSSKLDIIESIKYE